MELKGPKESPGSLSSFSWLFPTLPAHSLGCALPPRIYARAAHEPAQPKPGGQGHIQQAPSVIYSPSFANGKLIISLKLCKNVKEKNHKITGRTLMCFLVCRFHLPPQIAVLNTLGRNVFEHFNTWQILTTSELAQTSRFGGC